MNLNRDLKEFIESLNANAVRYLIVGGYAVAAHGHPRYTKDLDVWLELSPENADRVLAALRDFGFGEMKLTQADLTTPEQVVQLGYPPQHRSAQFAQGRRFRHVSCGAAGTGVGWCPGLFHRSGKSEEKQAGHGPLSGSGGCGKPVAVAAAPVSQSGRNERSA